MKRFAFLCAAFVRRLKYGPPPTFAGNGDNLPDRIVTAMAMVLAIAAATVANYSTHEPMRNASMFVFLCSFITCVYYLGKGFDSNPPGGSGA